MMKKVFIQGLGFVGSAMVAAVAKSKNSSGKPNYHVVGVDLDNKDGREKVSLINEGKFPFPTKDKDLIKSLSTSHANGNIEATTEQNRFDEANIILIDIPLDIPYLDEKPILAFDKFETAIKTIGSQIKRNSLIIIETTVPPGTCEKIVVPVLSKELKKRKMNLKDIYLAHSYERVMPGKDYLASITDFWRVFAGYNEKSGDLCEEFLKNIINTKDFPLTRLSSMTASESSKILENTYRATNIAFIDEWTKYAEEIGIDLFEIIDAIKKRPTHTNIMMPGLGVGGYCLTKDPMFAPASSEQLFDKNLEFPFSKLAVKTNHNMPIHTADRVISLLKGNIKDKKILICGVSYRQDIGDTRFSPSEVLVRELLNKNAKVICHDPHLSYWPELGIKLIEELPKKNQFDAIVFAVPHSEYKDIDLVKWLDKKVIILDANMVFDDATRKKNKALGINIESIGRATGL